MKEKTILKDSRFGEWIYRKVYYRIESIEFSAYGMDPFATIYIQATHFFNANTHERVEADDPNFPSLIVEKYISLSWEYCDEGLYEAMSKCGFEKVE